MRRRLVLVSVVSAVFCLATAALVAGQTATASAPVETAAKAAPAKGTLYRIDLKGAQSVWAAERPTMKGTLIVFPRHPDKALMSLASSSVARIVAVAPATTAAAGLKPGALKDIGLASGTPRGAAAGVAEAAAAGPTNPARQTGPGSTPEGMSAMDPSRPYNPTFDGTQVPGQSVAQPNSPNDNQVGRTWAHGPANATQSGPGQPPMMPPSSGDVPRGPQ